MRTVVLLICSNVFMTIAWYGHLKFKGKPLLAVIGASWLIALPEYILQVPANRFGHGQFSAPQLKIIQEAISIVVFIFFSALYLREMPNWRSALAFLLVIGAVFLVVTGPKEKASDQAGSRSAHASVASQGGQGPLEIGG